MTEDRNELSNELLDQLQRLPYLLRRAHHGAKHAMRKDGERQGEHRHEHHHGHADGHGRPDGCGKGGRHAHPGGGHPGGRGQARLLELLLAHDGILVKDIVEELDIRPSSASELVAKLERHGLVRTEPDADDRRAKRVHATEKAREYTEHLKAAHGRMATELLAGLSAQEQEQLLVLLRKVAASLEARE
jgi:DNA-binding MarR family transcriptional regulator